MTAAEKLEMLGHAPGLTNKDYHAAPGVSSSGLVALVKGTPAHYKAYITEKREQTDAMTFGSAVHMAVLEPDLFSKTYIAKPEGMSFATIEGKAWKADNKGKEILAFDKWQAVQAIQKRIFSDLSLKKYFSGGQAEQSYFWKDDGTGLICKCRPDYFDGKRVVDLKTAESASPWAFQKSIAKYRYDVQSAFYLAGMSKITGRSLTDFIHVVVETEAPYEVAVYVLDDASIDRASATVSVGMMLLSECMRDDKWPGYGAGVRSISSPNFLSNQEI